MAYILGKKSGDWSSRLEQKREDGPTDRDYFTPKSMLSTQQSQTPLYFV